MRTIDREKVNLILPKRDADANKYSVGSLLCVVGSRGFAGAAVLSLKAALRMGSGFVRCVLPKSIYPIVSTQVPEAVFVPMEENEDGTLCLRCAKEILKLCEKADAVLLGCGLGLNKDTIEVTSAILTHCENPLVLDADGLNGLSKHIDILKRRSAPIILTPHTGEMKRLTGLTSKYIEDNRLEVAEDFVREYECVLVLKGKNTLISQRNEETLVNPTGNPGMAVAGSGDVLSGMIAAFVAQGVHPFDAAQAGAYLHGLAGDIGAKELTEYSLLPSDIIDRIPVAIKEVIENGRQM